MALTYGLEGDRGAWRTRGRVIVTGNAAFWDSAIAVRGGVTVAITDSEVLGNADRWCDDYPDRCGVVGLGSEASDGPWLTFTATTTTETVSCTFE